MKEYILLYQSHLNKYFAINEKIKNSLGRLNYLLLTDFRPWDNDFLYRDVNLYNANFIYHDFENKRLYIGFGDWLIDENIDSPCWEEFSNYVKQVETCPILVKNFIEFREKWLALKAVLPPFAIIYRDDNDWVDCKGFDSKEEMNNFMIQYRSITN